MITLRYYDGGVQRSLDLMIDSVKDLKPIFKIYTPWLRKDVDAVFKAQGPGWPPLAASTLEHREQNKGAVAEAIRAKALNSLDTRLGSEQRRVGKRLEKRRLAVGTGPRADKLHASAQRAYERQDRLRAEFSRLRGEGQDAGYGPIQKSFQKLGERVQRRYNSAEARIAAYESGEALGRIANSMSVKIEATALEMKSNIPWAGVHNEGGTAGHGARIPQREFLAVTPARVQKLIEVTQEYLLRPMKK